jgi:hypothetical protein
LAGGDGGDTTIVCVGLLDFQTTSSLGFRMMASITPSVVWVFLNFQRIMSFGFWGLGFF